MPSLHLDNVAKHFGGLKAVDEVTMEVRPGEITGLIGPNGAGKSTVVNMISGVLALTEGDITVDGVSLATDRADVVARKGVARTFQNIRLLPEATVLENVLIGFHRREEASILSQLLGLPSARRDTQRFEEKAWDLLRRFRMEDYAEYEAGNLAYGHQRRVEMMRAIAAEPDIVLLDEPVAGMNDVESDELATIFRELAESGMALLLIEHNVGFVTRLCKQVYVLDSGRMIASGSPETVTSDPQVIAAYIGTSGH
ncbi:ABC transporter ATP-binding protein [Maritimibacter sp. UBA3975]|uniref:ABC transporter ATP-binding protein n=1 Tax=Maritimibacter sp. UBA3975 TaxID=1946833 RepID=UPI000C0BB230|nr:ABC transporter ATP-binding protein [Maritimibacter sp. UBA3975]MAM61296.1 ABC transporter ATP-binding protein [Maritimibacter sp.]|tara:strand:- start:2741 stop:3505 length:765 start_codon:yes stop_codon:yes gene_type:complete